MGVVDPGSQVSDVSIIIWLSSKRVLTLNFENRIPISGSAQTRETGGDGLNRQVTGMSKVNESK